MTYGSIAQTQRRRKDLGYQNFAVACECPKPCGCVTEWGDRNDELTGGKDYVLLPWSLEAVVQDEVTRA